MGLCTPRKVPVLTKILVKKKEKNEKKKAAVSQAFLQFYGEN